MRDNRRVVGWARRLRVMIESLPVVLGLTHGNAADWYVDANVDGGSANGTSWADAWPQLTNIVWASVNAGDTIWLSGGDYYGVMAIGKSGAEGAPITIKKSQAEGHNDHATLYGRISGGFNWITVDGAKDDSYANRVTYTYQVPNITNNIGFSIHSASVDTMAVNVFGTGPNGMRLLWLEVTTGPDITVSAEAQAININGGDLQNSEIAYCWLHDTKANGIRVKQDSVWNANSIIIHHNLIEDIGNDGIAHTGGVTMHHNIVRNTTELYGHPDGLVGQGHNTSIYNNIIYDWNTIPIYTGIRSGPGYVRGSPIVFSNYTCYGNVVYSDDLAESQSGALEMTVDAAFPWRTDDGAGGYIYVTNATYENVVIANNSFIAGRYLLEPMNLVNRYSPVNRPGEPGLVITLTNWLVANNLFYGGRSFAANFKGGEGSGYVYDPSQFTVSSNLFYSPELAGNRILYNSLQYYSNVAAFEAATGFAGNRSAAVAFVDFEGRDFRLSSADSAARGHGANLSALKLPGIEYDVWGNYRGDGAWDIGAIAYNTSGVPGPQEPLPPKGLNVVFNDLVLHLTFEDDFVGKGLAIDSSGKNAHMLRYGWGPNPTTNFPTAAAGRIGNRAAAFLPYYDAHPYTDPAFNDGQYGAITNAAHLQNLTNATFAAWVKFGLISVASPDDRTRNHNATILNAGYSTQGAWHWGRYYSSTYGEPQFNIQTNTAGGGAATWRNKWPQDQSYYTNNVWRHYAATFASGNGGTNLTVKLYLDGLPVVTNTLVLAEENKVTGLRIHDPEGATNPPWVAVGCWTHNGKHYLEADTAPNNGWLNGSLDDVRIYSRVLTDTELQALSARGGL